LYFQADIVNAVDLPNHVLPVRDDFFILEENVGLYYPRSRNRKSDIHYVISTEGRNLVKPQYQGKISHRFAPRNDTEKQHISLLRNLGLCFNRSKSS